MILYPAAVGGTLALIVISLIELASWRERNKKRKQESEELANKTKY